MRQVRRAGANAARPSFSAGLAAKAGLVELTGDDRAAIYGALLGVADLLKGADGPEMLTLWRRRGRRTFEAEDAATTKTKASP